MWVILNICFLRRGFVSTSSNPQARGPPLVGCPRLLIQFIHSYPPYWSPFLHLQPEDEPFRGDRDPHQKTPPPKKTFFLRTPPTPLFDCIFIFSVLYSFFFRSSLEILTDSLNASSSVPLILLPSFLYKLPSFGSVGQENFTIWNCKKKKKKKTSYFLTFQIPIKEDRH